MKQPRETPPTANDAAPAGRPEETQNRLKEILQVLARHDIVKGMTPEKLRNIVEEISGPTFVKLGQIVSMRQDMLPAAYCRELSKLRTEVSPMPFDEVRQVIEEECDTPAGTGLRLLRQAAAGRRFHRAGPRRRPAGRLAGGGEGTAAGHPGRNGPGHPAAAQGGPHTQGGVERGKRPGFRRYPQRNVGGGPAGNGFPYRGPQCRRIPQASTQDVAYVTCPQIHNARSPPPGCW